MSEEHIEEIQPGCVVTWPDYMFASSFSTAIIVQIDEEGGVYKGGRKVHLYPTRSDFPQERPGGDEVIFIHGRVDIQSSPTYIRNIDREKAVPLLKAAYKYGTLMSKQAIDAASATEIEKARKSGNTDWKYMRMPYGAQSNAVYRAFFEGIGFTAKFMRDKHAGMADVLFTTFGGVTGASMDITGADNTDEGSAGERVGPVGGKSQKKIKAPMESEVSQLRCGGSSSATSRGDSGGSGDRDRDENARNRSGTLSAKKKGKGVGTKNTGWSKEQIPLLTLQTKGVKTPGAVMARKVTKYGGFNWMERSRNGRVTDDSYNVVSEN